jgi:uncharacterized protein YbaP (TraB family)
MKLRHLVTLLAVFISFFSAMAFAQSSVWKVTKNGQYFYPGGTIHVLNQDDHPIPPEFSAAYEDSQKLVFEVDLNKSKTPEAQQKFLNMMLAPQGQTLSTELDAETFENLKVFMDARQIPIEQMQMFQPWAVALTLSMIEYQRMGMVPEYGVDQFFNYKAVLDNKQLGFLETIDEQLLYLSSMGEVEANLMIDYTLRDLESLPEFVSFMKAKCRDGDIEAFTEHEAIHAMKYDYPSVYDALIVKRNNNWIESLNLLNNNDVTEFVLVGALHLNGEDGLLSQLNKAEYKITQL